MPDSKITALTSISTSTDPANDPLVIVDVSDTSMAATGTTKKVTLNQLLATSPTATLASATITGAASAAGLSVTGSTIPTNGVYLPSANNLGFAYNSTLGMTLNSTGLGVGVASPATKLDVRGATNANQATFSGTAGRGLLISTRSDSLADDRTVVLSAQYATGSLGQLVIQTAGTDRLLVDNAGNVGIGVTPEAWTAFNPVLRIKNASTGGGGALGGTGIDNFRMLTNTYYDGQYKRIGLGYATIYEQGSGAHVWYSNGSGSAGSTFTPTQVMTLDASGNLVVGAVSTGNRRLEVKSAGTSNTTFAAHFRDSADTLLFHIRSDGYFNTGQGALSPYNNITASAANIFVDSSGFLYRSTSSLKYKTDVKDSVHGLADVLKLRPVTYKSKNGDDTVFGGLIAEEVHAAGLTEFVAYAPDNTPDAIHYSNMVSLLVAAIKELTARVQTLETR